MCRQPSASPTQSKTNQPTPINTITQSTPPPKVNGRIIDSAFTVAFNPRYDPLLAAVKAATEEVRRRQQHALCSLVAWACFALLCFLLCCRRSRRPRRRMAALRTITQQHAATAARRSNNAHTTLTQTLTQHSHNNQTNPIYTCTTQTGHQGVGHRRAPLRRRRRGAGGDGVLRGRARRQDLPGAAAGRLDGRGGLGMCCWCLCYVF